MPQQIKRNNIGFHDTTKHGAIIYKDNPTYYINGRKMPKWIFDDYFSKRLTFDKFINEKNEDIKGGIITLIKENEGNIGLLKFLRAKECDKKTIVHTSGHIEEIILYKTTERYVFLQDKNGNNNQCYAWIGMKCPSTGQEYLIDTSAHFDNAIDAMKFSRPSQIPMELEYNYSHFNN